MSDDRRAGKGRSLKATRIVAGVTTAKSVKVRMKTTMAGPGGSRHPEEVVDLSKAEASALIKAGAAVLVPSASTPGEGGVISDKDPFTDEDWSVGVIICRLLRAEAPEDCQEADRSYVPMSGTAELIALGKRYQSAVERLYRRLRQGLESEEYELRAPERRNDPFAKWKRLPPYPVSEVLDQYRYKPGCHFEEFRLKGCDGRVPVRLFRRRHRKESPRSFQTWVVDRLVEIESEYQTKMAAGKVPRKPVKEVLMEQLTKENSELSDTAFRNGWKDAQKRGLIPGIGKAGAPKGPRR